MNKQPERLISADKLEELLIERGNQISKEQFTTQNSDRLIYLNGEYSAMTNILGMIKLGMFDFDPDPIPLPTIKPGDKVRRQNYGEGIVYFGAGEGEFWVRYYEFPESLYLSKSDELEVAEDGR